MRKYEDITVSSVDEYLSKLNITESTIQVSSDFTICPVWRGQSSIKYDISPSACRNPQKFYNEKNYYLEMLRLMPEEFINYSELECLEKMQHYGISTRLLDFSTNPLVALFFACNENPQTDGVVYEVHGEPLYRENCIYSKIVLDFALNSDKRDFSTTVFTENLKRKYIDLDSLFWDLNSILDVLRKPIGLLPNYKNPRITNQSGVFFMCGLEVDDGSDPNKEVDFKRRRYSNIREFSPFSRSIIIPHENKKDILSVLSVCGISSMTMFPELPGVAEYVMKNTNKNYEQY